VCGSTEKKRELRYYVERAPATANLSADAVPDTNVITSVLKDYLRELPSPLIPTCIYRMLVDAAGVRLPNDRQANARLLFATVDCMPRVNKVRAVCVQHFLALSAVQSSFMLLMDHLKNVSSHAPHNGLSVNRLGAIFGPLLLCSASSPNTRNSRDLDVPAEIAANAAAAGVYACAQYSVSTKCAGLNPRPPSSVNIDTLNARLASTTLAYLLDVWPTASRNGVTAQAVR
jgi:hypothetical protein